jgi:DNA repair protein RecO (recombination protein O)
MAILKTEAIVLRTHDFRETSLIAHFFTKSHGRISAILKGIRKDARKFASTLEPFSLNEIIFYTGRSSELHLISQCDLKDNFTNIRSQVASIGFASCIVELVEHLMPLEERNEETYQLTLRALRQIDAGKDYEKIMRVFIIKFLKLIGFRPRLDGCVRCNEDIASSASFSAKYGGLLCDRCANVDSYCADVRRGTIASLLYMEENSYEDALRLALSAQIKNELESLLNNFMEFHLQIKTKSRQLLHTLT